MNKKTCFFMGNKHIPSHIKEQLVKVVEQHISEYGVTTFIVGNYGAFDNLVKKVLREVKIIHPNIMLYLLTPYALNKNIEIPDGFDGTLYPDGLEKVPLRLAIVYANRKITEQSDYLIAYCRHIGNTMNIVKYAKMLEKRGLIKVTLL